MSTSPRPNSVFLTELRGVNRPELLAVEPTDRLHSLQIPIERDTVLRVFLVEPEEGATYLLIDEDLDDSVMSLERHDFEEPNEKESRWARKLVRLRIPIKIGRYEFVPLWIGLSRNGRKSHHLLVSGIHVAGSVNLGGERVALRYAFPPGLSGLFRNLEAESFQVPKAGSV